MSRRAALLVAESGGHLEQLTRLERRLRPAFDEATYVTSESDQSKTLLAGRRVRYARRVPPRGLVGAARGFVPALRTLRRSRATDVISTGSAIAVPYLVAARLLGRRAHYIESAARTSGPSVTGRILRRVPGVHLYAQYRRWADAEWRYEGSVFDGYSVQASTDPKTHAGRVVVTLGTMSQYPFDRAVAALERVLPEVTGPDTHFLWQVGEVTGYALPGDVHSSVPADDLRAAIRQADLVIAHAGTGSSLQILDAGRVPVLLPRSQEHGEHIDDHQQLIADELQSRGLAVIVDPDALRHDHLLKAMASEVSRDDQTSPFTLADGSRPD
ncbi:glycosyltransferase [Ornithinimicrobium sp. LYQ92]|uniref:glycosyltransferase n=1 Tax=Serinicoccus sp. LYQ92 TaxID=3378798 RepID=UPI0038541AAD